jgi:hypothetical protein
MKLTITDKVITRAALIASIALFLASLTTHAYCAGDCADSLAILLTGWLGVITEIGSFANWIMNYNESTLPGGWGSSLAWVGNPFLILSWLVMRRNPPLAFRLSIIAVVFALSFLFFDKVIGNEAGHYRVIREIKAGYWLWLASAIAMTGGAWILFRSGKTFPAEVGRGAA